MSRTKTTIRLLLLCLAAFAALWFADRATSGAQRGNPGSAKLVATPFVAVNRIVVEHGASRMVLRLAESGQWFIDEPVAVRASSQAVLRFLDDLERLPQMDFIDAREVELRDLSPGDFGFDKPQARVVVSGPSKSIDLVFGNATATTNGVFVAFASDAGARVTSPSILESVCAPIEKFADLRVLQGSPRLVTAMTFFQPGIGMTKLERRGHSWNIVHPVEKHADWNLVNELFRALFSSTIDRFDVGGVSLEKAGLSSDGGDSEWIQFLGENAVSGRSLVIGAPVPGEPGKCYAKSSDVAAVVVVSDELRKLARTTYQDVRDRRLFAEASMSVDGMTITRGGDMLSLANEGDRWIMTAPVVADTDPEVVARLLNSVLSLAADGFHTSTNEPLNSLGMVLRTSAGTYAMKIDEMADGTCEVGLSRDGDGAVEKCVVGKEAFSTLFELFGDPRALVSRNVMNIDKASVARVVASHLGSEPVMVECAGGDATNSVSAAVVDSVMAASSPLVAVSVEALSVDEDDAYSLSSPLAEVSFDFSGTNVFRKTLQIGGHAASGGRYAKILGQDPVYVISIEAVAPFLQPFQQPAEEGDEVK